MYFGVTADWIFSLPHNKFQSYPASMNQTSLNISLLIWLIFQVLPVHWWCVYLMVENHHCGNFICVPSWWHYLCGFVMMCTICDNNFCDNLVANFLLLFDYRIHGPYNGPLQKMLPIYSTLIRINILPSISYFVSENT